jgi:hypothetical protein
MKSRKYLLESESTSIQTSYSTKLFLKTRMVVFISTSAMSYNQLNCTWNNSSSHLRVPVLFTPVYQLRHRFASLLRSTSQYIQWNMVDCGNSRCSQERRAFRKELLSWSKKIPLAVGKFFSNHEIFKKRPRRVLLCVIYSDHIMASLSKFRLFGCSVLWAHPL